MGKKIDYFVLTAGITALAYFYFYSRVKNRMAAVILALLFCALLRKILHMLAAAFRSSRFAKKRCIQRKASAAMLHLACMNKEEAVEKLTELLNKAYDTDFRVEVIQLHPSASVDKNTIFEVWKRYRGSKRLAICLTCRADTEIHAFASSLKEPKLAIIDSTALTDIIAEHPGDLIPKEVTAVRQKLRFHHLTSLLFNRKNASKCLLTSLSMFMIYVFSSNTLYLFVAFMLIFCCLVSLRRQGRPSKLF